MARPAWIARRSISPSSTESITVGGAPKAGSWRTEPSRNATAFKETDTAEYAQRTERNVLDSDATLIIGREPPLTGGTLVTFEFAQEHGKPVLIVCESEGVEQAASRVAAFLKENRVTVLNVAGPRESQAAGIGTFVRNVLGAALVV